MGWKASTIIVNKPTNVDYEKILNELGFKNLTKIKDEPFEEVIYPANNKVYIGTYKDNLLICEQQTLLQFFENSESKTEAIFKKLFPSSEICAIILHSSINLWGFSVIKNGRKLRARAGNSDDGTILDIGDPLEEEKEILSKSRIDKNGNRTYVFEEIDDEPMTEDQVGENFVFAICKRYFGEELDSADDLLFKTELVGYSYSAPKLGEEPNLKKTKNGKWPLYLAILGMIIIWQILKRTVFK